MENEKQSFMDEMFSDGERASFGRVASFLALVIALIWVSLLLNRVQTMADLKEVAAFLESCTFFVSALFGISKISDTIALFTAKFGGPKT